MVDWTKPMQQTFEYYIVDPNTWKDTKPLTKVKSCTITRDSGLDTLGSATLDVDEALGECYVRVYMVTIQNGVKEKHPMGTFLVQTPSSSFDGKVRSVSMDAYTPLLELKEKQPPIGYYVPKSTKYFKVEESNVTYTSTSEEVKVDNGEIIPDVTTLTGELVYAGTSKTDDETIYYIVSGPVSYRVKRNATYTVTTEELDIIHGSIVKDARTVTGERVFFGKTSKDEEVHYCATGNLMDIAYRLARENLRAPVSPIESDVPLNFDFVSDPSDSWFTFINDLIANANHKFVLDELGRVLFAPHQDTASLQPVWTYADDDISILYPDLEMDHDLYGIPNVVEVVYSSDTKQLYSRVVNDDVNSPTSTVNRGRELITRITDPDLVGIPTQEQIDEYARQQLRNLSTIEYTVTYSHGYCPVRIDDCVRINYSRAQLTNIKARVISQSINCEPGCKVTEKAVFTTKLWG